MSEDKKRVLITGGAGFIGSHLADQMLERGFAVTVLDNLSPQVHGDAELDDDGWPVYLNPDVERIRGDVLDAETFESALDGVTHLAHLAASVGVGQSMTNIVEYTRNNVMAAAVMLETLAQKSHSIERMAVASSMSIYGEGEYIRPSTGDIVTPDVRTHAQLEAREWEPVMDGEELTPRSTSEIKLLQPNSIYAVNKRDHEEMFLAVGRALKIPTVALRLFNAYGSRQALSNPYTGVAAIFISRLLNDQPPLIFEDGKQLRDFVHVDDVARAFATVIDSDKEIWDIFNVGSGEAISIYDLAKLLARVLGKNIAPEILYKYRVGDVRHCFGDMSKIEKAFGFKPKHDLEKGMEELVEWVRHAKSPVNRSDESLEELSNSKMVV